MEVKIKKKAMLYDNNVEVEGHALIGKWKIVCPRWKQLRQFVRQNRVKPVAAKSHPPGRQTHDDCRS